MAELDFLNQEQKKEGAIPEAKKEEPKKRDWRSFFKLTFKKETQEKEVLATDLIQREIVTYFNWKSSIVILLLLVFLDILVLFSGYQGLIYWEKNEKQKVEEINQELNGVNMQVMKAKKNLNEITLFQNKIEKVRFVLDHHIYWTNYFKFLEENLLKDINFKGGFIGKTDGKFTFSGETKDFYRLTEQLKYLKNNKNVLVAFSSGGSVGGKFGDSVVNFDLELAVNPEIFYFKK